VADLILPDDVLMEKFETELDKESRVLKNWYHIGKRLGLPEPTLQEIRVGNYKDHVGGFFELCVYTRFSGLTVGKFKEIMTDIGRNDVVQTVAGVDEGKLCELKYQAGWE